MSDKPNPRRKNKARVADRFDAHELHNGYKPSGKHGALDKSMHSWGATSTLADVHIGASIPNDFTNGRRGMAKSVRGAKKFVRSRIRFHEKAATRALTTQDHE